MKRFVLAIGFLAVWGVVCFVSSCSRCLCAKEIDAVSRSVQMVKEEGNESNSSYTVEVSVDHENHLYEENDYLNITVKAGGEGYLYLLYIDAEKNPVIIYPNPSVPEGGFLHTGDEVQVPGDIKDYNNRVTGPFGKEILLAVLSKKKLDIAFNPKGFTRLSNQEMENMCKNIAGKLENQNELQSKGIKYDSENLIAVSDVEITTRPKGAVSKTAERYLVCVGIDEYKNKELNLHFCVNDVNSIEDIFKKRCSLKDENITTLTNSEATLDNIKKTICEELPQKTKPGDTIFLYWSGHGHKLDIPDNGSGDKDKNHCCLVTYDTNAGDLSETSLVDKELGDWIGKLNDRNFVIILDACYAAGLVQGKSIGSNPDIDGWNFHFDSLNTRGDGFQSKDISLSGNAIISSCSSSELSLGTANKNSLMTKHLVKALEAKDRLTPQDLYEQIAEPVEKEALKYDAKQHVSVDGDIKTTVIINP